MGVRVCVKEGDIKTCNLCVFPSKHSVSVRNHLHVELLENALQNPFTITNVKWWLTL